MIISFVHSSPWVVKGPASRNPYQIQTEEANSLWWALEFSVRVSARIKRKPTRYEVSVVTRDEVGAYKPYLWEQSVFEKGPMFREWLLTKIVNGERASYSAPKFARMQERTRSQMLEDIVANLANHAETGQIPKPYRRGSWRPIGEDPCMLRVTVSCCMRLYVPHSMYLKAISLSLLLFLSLSLFCSLSLPICAKDILMHTDSHFLSHTNTGFLIRNCTRTLPVICVNRLIELTC
uniref:Rap-GAP domain-containing protein n=1 Tax=Anopheles maculatus TaxID=74869 RepID=A0A182SN22_9DIPT